MCESLQSVENSTNTCGFCFFGHAGSRICLLAVLVCVHGLKTKYVTRTYHLLEYVYVEGPDFVYTVNVISLFFSIYLKCIEYIIRMKAFH